MATTWTAGEPGRSYRMMRDPGPQDHDPALRARRVAIDGLGDALRELVERAATTEAPTAELLRAAEGVRAVTAGLGPRVRRREQVPSADDLLGGIRMYNPVTGTGSPLAPPLRIELVDGEVRGWCTLGLAFEGPPMYTHGGVSALLLDQMLGYATSAAGHPGLTIELVTRFHRPVPLQTPLVLRAAVIAVDGQIVTAEGSIAAEAEPGTVLVRASGTFKELRPDQSARLFARALNPTPPSAPSSPAGPPPPAPPSPA